ncbi:unnamed protein product [Mytilus edulis]|uniref:Uncharacterized protein n=1 Tax=Mytilus edulis TaxID=6550 RepID=A0A8S3VG85_MYTED|nr:unnamed protein product [Mytilus edulis]
MVGKTFIDMCAARLTGCKETHIVSRCTLAFVNSWLTKSTLPFIWDDPTVAEDVSQVAADVHNGCVRRKSTDQSTKTPLTGCMVNANFDFNNFMKIIEQTSPVSFILKNQLDGTTTKAHAEQIRLAKLDWEIPNNNQGRALRKAVYVVPIVSQSEDSSDDESIDSDTPLNQIAKSIKKAGKILMKKMIYH